MVKTQLSPVIRHIRKLVGAYTDKDLTDGQLVQSFAGHHDENAFAALVERHGQLVLSACRQVLRNEQDAEDAFQATFMVLARRAASIRRSEAVGSWLYRIAYRVATKAGMAMSKRRTHEKQARSTPPGEPHSELAWRELQAVLQEELDRLPEKYRAPFVVCCLEGKTQGQAARQLGWKEGTVSGRLAQARKELQRRLTRRGVALSVVLCALALSQKASAVVPSVSPKLLSATIVAAIAFARGITTADSVSASVACLAEGMVKTMLMTKMKMIGAVVLAASVLGTGVIICRALASKAAPDTLAQNRVEKRQPTRPRSEKERAFAEKPAVPDERVKTPLNVSASGKVINKEGNPIPGATVYLREMAILRDAAELGKKGYTDILAQTTTDVLGRFAFKDVVAEPMKISPANIYRHPWSIVVTAKGYGLGWHVFKSRDDQNLALIMQPEARLRGRLVTSNGKPAVSVQVRLLQVDGQLDPDPRNQVFSIDQLELYWSRLPLAAVTDAEGRFVFEGLPTEQHIGLLASGPQIARKWLNCATIDKMEVDRLNETGSVPAESKLLADGFTATLQPIGSVKGKVIYGETGTPAVGSRVTMGIYGTVTDSQGRYSLEGFSAQKLSLYVNPPEDMDYLASEADVTISAEKPIPQQDFILERGSVITGELQVKETGQPLRVPYVQVWYQYEGQGPKHSPTTRTKADGSFRIVVRPGNGKLYTNDSVPGCVPLELISESGIQQVSLPIEIKARETLKGKNLLFLRGMVVQGRVLDAKGKPVAGAVFQGATEQSPSNADGTFTLRGLSPDHRSHFHVVQAQGSLGAEITIEPSNTTDPVAADVELQPTRSATARVIDEDKQPVANALVSLLANIKLKESGNGFTFRPIPVSTIRPDSAGKYVLLNLVVGGSYTVNASAKGFASVQAHFRVESGKKPKVPDLMLLASEFALAGVVIDQVGKPVEGVQLTIQPRNVTLVSQHNHFMETKKDGRFQFRGLARGDYRLLANVWRPTGEIDKDGRPVHEALAQTHLQVQVEAGKENLRIVLDLPPK